MKKNVSEIEDAVDTSSTTAKSPQGTSSSSGTQNPEGTIFIKSKDLKKPKIMKTIEKAKSDKMDIKIVEGLSESSNKLEYLSEVKDSESGDISQPFTIKDKKYQMVRAINSKKEKVMGVYSFDEKDETGNNVIYGIEEFEQKIVNKKNSKNEKMENESKLNQPFEGYKHFIVNGKTGKARKFKKIEELAKAQMTEDEKYMSVKEFKKYLDETLFGTGKKSSVNEVSPTGKETDEEMNVKAQKLMTMIGKRIPPNVINSIKTNKIAQREVIAAFAELIGVPRNGLTQLISGLRDLAKTPKDQQQPVTESKKVIKTIKVKDIK